MKLFSRKSELKKYDIGRFTYGEPRVKEQFGDAKLKIGSFCSIGRGVTIMLGGNHRSDWVTTYPFSIFFKEFKDIKGHPTTKGDVIIGNDVWIGRGATILSGVTIGDGAVIGAYSVVTKSVEPYAIAAGNPAKIIRKRFEDNIIQSLLDIKWWDWDIERIKKFVPLMLSSDIQKFIEAARGKGFESTRS